MSFIQAITVQRLPGSISCVSPRTWYAQRANTVLHNRVQGARSARRRDINANRAESIKLLRDRMFGQRVGMNLTPEAAWTGKGHAVDDLQVSMTGPRTSPMLAPRNSMVAQGSCPSTTFTTKCSARGSHPRRLHKPANILRSVQLRLCWQTQISKAQMHQTKK